MKRDAMIKEERRKQNEEMSNILMKQIKDIEDLKVSVEREKDELRRKRVEVRIFFLIARINCAVPVS
jgi:hypothetical protein